MNTYDVIASNKSFSGVDMVAQCQITIPGGAKETYTLGSLQTLSYSIHMQRAPIRSIGNINAKDYVLGPRTIAGSLVFAVFNKHLVYEIMGSSIQNKYKPQYAFLIDELPPFDVTISFANEYGVQSRMVIYGIRLVNEGQVMSVNDIYTENTYQFVATDLEYLTDANGYSTYTAPGSKIKIDNSAKYDNTTTGKEVSKKIKDKTPTDSKDQKVYIKVSPISSAINGKKGTVKISVAPWQTSGTLTIKGESLSPNIEIDVSEYKNEGVYIALNAGSFTAKFSNNENRVYSDEKKFIVTSYDTPVPTLQAAPVIEFCTDKKISVYANAPKHDKLKFAEVNGTGDLDWNQVDLKSKRVTIQGLKEGTTYLLYTFGNGTESMKIYVTTDEFMERPYEDLKKFILCNKNILVNGTLEEYINIVNEAKKIAIASTEDISVSTAVIKYKDTIQLKISSLKPSDFPNQTEYTSKLNDLNRILSMCYYLINMSNMLNNDTVVYMNQKTTIKPPAPELADAINCVFLFNENIDRLEFYRQYNNVTQFASEVTKIAFFNHSSGKKGYRFIGKPGYNYYVHAFNLAGERSPKVQFYIMTDEERAKNLDIYYKEKDSVNSLLLELERSIGPTIEKLNLSSENHKRLLVETAKAMEANVFPAPTVVGKATDRIVLDVSNNESLGMFVGEFYAVIADTEDALYKRATYKQLITTNRVEFSTSYGGVKPDRSYVIWIENSYGAQVSPSITTAIYTNETSDIIEQEENIELYRIENIMNQISTTLGNKISISTEIAAAINNLKEDDTVTYKNVFDKLTFNIMSYVPKLANTDEIIKSIFESKMDIMYHIDIDFFSNVKVENNTITFAPRNQEYMISMYGINHNEISNTPMKVPALEFKSITYDRSSRYVVLFATGSDLYTKSGMIFIDTLTNHIKTYKIKIGG